MAFYRYSGFINGQNFNKNWDRLAVNLNTRWRNSFQHDTCFDSKKLNEDFLSSIFLLSQIKAFNIDPTHLGFLKLIRSFRPARYLLNLPVEWYDKTNHYL